MEPFHKEYCPAMRRLMQELYFCICIFITFLGIVGSKQATVRMLIRDQNHVLYVGQTLEVSCEFQMTDFELFENPIIWKKVQSHEETRINIMSNIVEPFISTERFSVIFAQTPPRYKLVLTIVDISLEDYGNYTCEVRGTQTTILASLTHYVYVKSPVKSITISDFNRTITRADIQRTLEFTEGDRCSLQCISYGGCPSPQMTLHLGNHEITSHFSLDYSSKMSGVKGLRVIEHRVERWTDQFKVTASHDNKRLQCIVTVPHSGSSIATARLRVKYAPIIVCDKTYAFAGDRNAFLRCDVTARPALTSMFWVIDDRGTTLSQGQVHDGYWTVNADDTRLYMKITKPDSFRSYTLVAENVIGTTSEQVLLTRKFNSSSSLHSDMQLVKPSVTYMDTRNSAYSHMTSGSQDIRRWQTIFCGITSLMNLLISKVFYSS